MRRDLRQDRSSSGYLNRLLEVNLPNSEATIRSVVQAAREELGLDIAYLNAFHGDEATTTVIDGENESFGLYEGTTGSLDQSYCLRMINGEIPNVVANAKQEPGVNSLACTEAMDIGSYVGVPVQLSDGRLYGSFCAISHQPDPVLKAQDLKFMHVLAKLIGDTIERQELEEQNVQLRVQTAALGAMLAALEARDGYTGEHSNVVLSLAEKVGEVLGLPATRIDELRQVALLHDIGKIGIPDSVLQKRGPLDEEEWALMRTHPEVGEKMITQIEGLGHLGPAIRAEHERWDGTGYPDGLKGEEIPLESRVVLACDAWHAMTSDRPYRKAMSIGKAIAQLQEGKGSQFDPAVVDAVVRVVTTS